MKFENDEVERITLQVKGGLLETDSGFHIGQEVMLLVKGSVVNVEHKVNERNGRLSRHHVVKYREVEVIRKVDNG